MNKEMLYTLGFVGAATGLIGFGLGAVVTVSLGPADLTPNGIFGGVAAAAAASITVAGGILATKYGAAHQRKLANRDLARTLIPDLNRTMDHIAKAGDLLEACKIGHTPEFFRERAVTHYLKAREIFYRFYPRACNVPEISQKLGEVSFLLDQADEYHDRFLTDFGDARKIFPSTIISIIECSSTLKGQLQAVAEQR